MNGLRANATLIAGVIGMGLIASLALIEGGKVDTAIAQIAGIVGLLVGRSMGANGPKPGGP